MSQNPNSAVAVIGIDIGKNSFHVVGLDTRGAILLRQKWSRKLKHGWPICETAKELRSVTRRLARARHRHRSRDLQKQQKYLLRLNARFNALVDTLVCPCPSLYGARDYADDRQKYAKFARKRTSRRSLTKAENVEEARLLARITAYAARREVAARARISDLDQRLHNNCAGPPLSIVEQSHLRGLRTLYPRELPPPIRDDSVFKSAFLALCELVAAEAVAQDPCPS